MSIITEALKKAQMQRLRKGRIKGASAALRRPKGSPKGVVSRKSSNAVPIEMPRMPKIHAGQKTKTGLFPSRRPVIIAGILGFFLLAGGITFLFMTVRSSKPALPSSPDGSRIAIVTNAPNYIPEGLSSGKIVPITTPPHYELENIVPKQKASQEEVTSQKKEEAKYYTIYYEPESLPSLSGIMHSPTNPQAIINGELVSEGETLEGFKIQKILPDRVKLGYGGKEYELKLR